MFTRIKTWFRNKWNTLRRHPAARVALAVSVAALMGMAVYFAVVVAFTLFTTVATTAMVLALMTTTMFIAVFVSTLKGNSHERPTLHGALSTVSWAFAWITVFVITVPLVFPMTILIAAWELAKAMVYVGIA